MYAKPSFDKQSLNLFITKEGFLYGDILNIILPDRTS